jgi:trans-aconitate methyltransferase
VDRLVNREGLHVLDAGCGDGLLAEAIARQNPTWKVVGIDSSPTALESARIRTRDAGLGNVRFVEANLTEPIDAPPYEIIFAIECLEEIEDDESALRVLADALAPGGLLLVHVPERGWRPLLPGSSPTWRHEVRHGYSRTGLTDQIEGAGLAVLEVSDSYHRLVQLAQEIRDRIKTTPTWARALAFPLMLVAVRLEAAGLRWGRGQALFAVAVRHATAADEPGSLRSAYEGPATL